MSDVGLNLGIAWCWFVTTWFANINDLIRGDWFYFGWQSVLIANFFGLIAFIIIISHYANPCKEEQQ